MLRRYPQVRRWEQTDDLLQAALVRLHRSLAEVRPEGVRHFDNLAARQIHRRLAAAGPEGLRHFENLAAAQIRRELIDLARRHGGPEGIGAHHHSDGAAPGDRLAQVAAGDGRPEALEDWAAFHEAVGRLPEAERAVVDLL